MEDERERLVELVRGYVELYDTSTAKYSDNFFKDNIWKVIGEELNKTGAECKAKWANLRDQYRRYLKKVNTKSGVGDTKPMVKWKFADAMSFVRPFLNKRDTVTNLDDPMNVSQHEWEETDEEQPTLAKKKRCDDTDITENYFNNCSYSGSGDYSGAAYNVTSKIRTKSNKFQKQSSETASSVLMKYLLDTQKDEKQDSVDIFFQSIASTVKDFSPHYRNVCKMKVLALVSELEMCQISDQQSPSADEFVHPTTSDLYSSIFTQYLATQVPHLATQVPNPATPSPHSETPVQHPETLGPPLSPHSDSSS